jgi:hypothetical protein
LKFVVLCSAAIIGFLLLIANIMGQLFEHGAPIVLIHSFLVNMAAAIEIDS